MRAAVSAMGLVPGLTGGYGPSRVEELRRTPVSGRGIWLAGWRLMSTGAATPRGDITGNSRGGEQSAGPLAQIAPPSCGDAGSMEDESRGSPKPVVEVRQDPGSVLNPGQPRR